VGSLEHGAHIVVGTPGRILKHLKKGTLRLEALHAVVFDEADRMLDMGFTEEIDALMAFAPDTRQTLLFSATFPEEIVALSQRFQRDPKQLKASEEESANQVQERFFATPSSDKLATLVRVFATFAPRQAMVFTNTKADADAVGEYLFKHGIDALSLHGDLEQYERNDVLVQFANHSCAVLVATDVAARGLDIKAMPLVVNYDAPHTKETYVHRIGRTARAGETGMAITLMSSGEDPATFCENAGDVLSTASLKEVSRFSLKPPFRTLVIEGGKKEKLRPGDILGALTGDVGLDAKRIGKIDIYERQSYVAIAREEIDAVKTALDKGKIKGKSFPVWIL
jgi:ATP-independent RNA helicase DbpA